MAFTYAGRYGDWFQDTRGNALASAVVTVYTPNTTTKATIYTDRTKATELANPITCDARGFGEFWAEPGSYDLLVTNSVGTDLATVEDVTVHPDKDDFTNAGTNLLDVTDAEYGATGDGETDDQAAIQTALTDATDGTTVLFPKGRYSVESALSWTGKALHLRFDQGATLVESTAIDGPIVTVTNGDGSSVKGATCEGVEDETSFEAQADASVSDRCFVKFVSTDDARVSGVTISGKSVGLAFSTSHRAQVSDVRMVGFGTSTTTNVNFHTAVHFDGSDYGQVRGLSVSDIGSGVLCGTDAQYVHIDGVIGDDCFDHVVYVSSGSHCTITNVSGKQSVAGTGGATVQARGSYHTVSSCRSDGAIVGFSVTGNGVTADPHGANGAGNRILGCVAVNTTRDGFLLGSQDSLLQRDMVLIGNTAINCATSGAGYAAYRISGWRLAFQGNTAIDCDGATADLILSGVDASTQTDGHSIVGNTFVGSAGEGMRLSNIKESVVANNVGINVTNELWDADNVEDSFFFGNRKSGTGSTRLGDFDSASTGCLSLADWGGAGGVLDNGSNQVTGGGPDANWGLGSGRVRAGSGSVSLPSLSFSTETDTGWYRRTAQQLAASVGGIHQLTVGSGFLQLVDGTNLTTGVTAGSQIASSASQKLGFFGATPVVQQAKINDPAGGSTVDTEARTAINAIIDALEAIGISAAA